MCSSGLVVLCFHGGWSLDGDKAAIPVVRKLTIELSPHAIIYARCRQLYSNSEGRAAKVVWTLEIEGNNFMPSLLVVLRRLADFGFSLVSLHRAVGARSSLRPRQYAALAGF